MDNINDLNDFDRGELDCLYGYDALEGQSESYYEGYRKQYATEQIQTARTEQ